jgi:polyisoprenoid-binding protein YceI
MTGTHVEDLSGDYVLDQARTRLGFVARHAMVSRVHGHFERFSGRAHIDMSDSSRSRIEVDIEAGSVTTNNRQRDAHLRTGDFFDVAHHPVITYRSVDFAHIGDSIFSVLGHLTIRGVSKLLPLEFRSAGATADEEGIVRIEAQASTVVSRREWGLTWSGAVEAGGIVVADSVTLQLVVAGRRVSEPAEQLPAPSWRGAGA